MAEVRVRSSGLLVVCVAAGLLGCDLLTAPSGSGEPVMRTDRSEYPLDTVGVGWVTWIPYSFTNHGDTPVYLTNCNGSIPLSLERRQGSGWITAWVPIMQLCLSRSIKIEAGEVFRDTVWVFAGDPASRLRPMFRVDEVGGSYRIVWATGFHDDDADARGGELLPREQRTSNRFTLTPPK